MSVVIALLASIDTSAQTADSAFSAAPSPQVIQVVTREGLPPDQPDPEQIRRLRVHAGEMWRVRGEFGEFVGRVGSITTEGLSQLEPHDFSSDYNILWNSTPSQDRRPPAPPALLSWSEVDDISRRVGHGRLGAVIGATVVGLGGVLLGSAYGEFAEAEGGQDGVVLVAAAAGGAAGIAAGAIVGSLIGTAIHGWHAIYPDR